MITKVLLLKRTIANHDPAFVRKEIEGLASCRQTGPTLIAYESTISNRIEILLIRPINRFIDNFIVALVKLWINS